MSNVRKIARPRNDGMPQGTRDGILQAALLIQLTEHIPGLQLLRWREKVLEAFSDTEDVQCTEDDFADYISGFRFIPDAFLIDKADMRLDFFEVEITSLMTTTKLQAYGEFKTIMDYYGIEFCLFSVNQHGHINEVELFQHYLDWVKAQNDTRAAEWTTS